MLWLSESLRSILTPPTREAEIKAAIEVAKVKHAERLTLIREQQAITHARLASDLSCVAHPSLGGGL